MLKKIFRLVKKIVFAGLAIYAYNVLATPINATIPINFITLLSVAILGMPCLAGLIILMLIFY